MELVTLDSTTLQPVKMVENYNSLLWTERYSSSGDFELKTFAVQDTMNLLPLESVISLRDTTVPMRVEVYKIEKSKDTGNTPQLTVTGRSYESCTERRAAVQAIPTSTKRPAWTINAASASDAAFKALRVVLGDVGHYDGTTPIIALTPPVVAEDAIPEISLTLPADFESGAAWNNTTTYNYGDVVSSGTNFDGSKKYWIALATNTATVPVSGAVWTENVFSMQTGDLYSSVLAQIAANYHGIKSVRPDVNNSTVGVEIYNGADRRQQVTFDVRFNQFDDATYLLSDQGSTNVAYVDGPTNSQIVFKNSAVPSGLDRRVLWLDLSSESSPDLNSRGLVELYKYNATAMFDGQIADSVGAGYNKNYFLGDIIHLIGEYGLSRDARVTEFIRSSDSSGERSYPTLEVIDAA